MAQNRLTNKHAAWHDRQERWRHTGFLGFAAMMKSQARAIQEARTTTPDAKHMASLIESLATQLSTALKERLK